MNCVAKRAAAPAAIGGPTPPHFHYQPAASFELYEQTVQSASKNSNNNNNKLASLAADRRLKGNESDPSASCDSGELFRNSLESFQSRVSSSSEQPDSKWQTIPLGEGVRCQKRRKDSAECKDKQEEQEVRPIITSCTQVASGQQQTRETTSVAVGTGEQQQQQDERTAKEAEANGAEARKRETRKRRVSKESQLSQLPADQDEEPGRGQQIGKVRAPFLFAGILGSILGSVFFSVGMLTIKLLPDGHGLAEKTKIVFFRGCILMMLCGLTIIYQKSTFRVRRDELWVNVLRSVLGFAGVYGAYISLKYISMGDSTALVFSSPIWTSLLSHFILNEPLQWIQLLALPASLVGIILIAHPALLVNMEQVAGVTERQPQLDVVEVVEEADMLPLLLNETTNMVNFTANTTAASGVPVPLNQILANLSQTLNRDLDIAMNSREQFDFEHRWKGILVALGTSFIVSFVYIVLKFRKSTPIQTTTFWLGAATVVASLCVMCFTGLGQMPRGAYEWTLLLLNGFCSWMGQVLLQWALAYEDASVLSVVRTLDVAITFTLSALFLEEQILWTSVLGAAIIATVVVSIMLNGWLSRRLCPSASERQQRARQHEQQANSLTAPVHEKRPGSDLNELTLKLQAPPLVRNGSEPAA